MKMLREAADKLGRITMYRLVLGVLALMAVASFALTFLGALPYTPIDIAASAVVAVGVALLSGHLLAAAVQSAAQWESSAITGFLVFFLFWPTADPGQLWRIALVSVIASVSKYVLVWRGRHLFNPVAIAAVIASVTGLTAAVWWPANAYLFPVVLVGAIAVVVRTRKLLMFALYVVVATLSGTVVLVLNGTAALDALPVVLLSYPVVFLGGFMLTEPLTLPPRRWQQLMLAAVAGVLVSVPFHVGPLYNSPELTLVVMNLAAALFARRSGIRLTLLGRKLLSPTVVEFSFRPKRPLDFVPGQYLELVIPHGKPDSRGTRRMLSPTSVPGSAELVTVATSMPAKTSTAKRALRLKQEGAVLSATGVWGDFVLPRDPSVPVLLVAGGIGITPFVSQLRSDRMRGIRRDVTLVYAARSAAEYAYLDDLVGDGVRIILAGPEAPAQLPVGCELLGAERISGELLALRMPDLRARHAFVSGPPSLVEDLREDLKRQGVRSVHTDVFLGY
ncbi:FAD-dependent oxidoreductase [Lysinibacter cavernae]|uniref:Ferredoxin-NADP reductase n=1 Tax=Lysinibacter cavernae TaxID=1640652 RepID=A0A7X5TSV8_9MICO|nr:oxidoreductase [Lysinibacter cavernae]NIH53470.1 ferredoxin-NADP reductase [Lysinibacter cavernae]